MVKGRRIYDEAVREAVIVAWEATDRICGKRLKAALPHLVESMERHGHLDLDPEVRERLLAASAATLDRLLKPVRTNVSGRRKRGGTCRQGATSRCGPLSRVNYSCRKKRPLFLPVHPLGLAPLLGGISPVAGDVKLQDHGVVHDPVNRRGGGHGVGEDALPL